MNIRKMIISGVVGVFLVFTYTLSAYAGGQNESSAAGSQTLRIGWWGSQTRNTETLAVIKMFEQAHPGLTVEPEMLGWGDYWQKMNTEAAGGNLPDVMQQSIAYVQQYVNKGLLADLGPYVSSGTLDMSDVSPNENAQGVVNGKLYGINAGTSADTIVYDPQMFKSAGVPLPSFGWTWDDVIKAANTIHQKLGIYGSGRMDLATAFPYYLEQQGQELFNKDQTALGYTDNKYFITFITMRKAMQDSGAMPPIAEIAGTPNLALEDYPIVHGKAAMAWVQANQIVALSAAAKRPLALAPFPSGGPGTKQGAELSASMLFSLGASSHNQKLAAEFLSYFTNSIPANKTLLAERGVPISSKVRDALKSVVDPIQGQVFDYVSLLVRHSVPSVPVSASDASSKVQYQMLQDVIFQYLYGKVTAEQAAANFREQATATLSQG